MAGSVKGAARRDVESERRLETMLEKREGEKNRLWKVVEGCGRREKVVEGEKRLWKEREGCGRLEKAREGWRRLWKVVEGKGRLERVVEGRGRRGKVGEGCGRSWFEEELRALRLKVSGLHTYSSKKNVMLSTPWWLPKATIKGVLLTQHSCCEYTQSALRPIGTRNPNE